MIQPYEVMAPDGAVYIHQDNWNKYRDEKLNYYPRKPGQLRLDICLWNPSLFLKDVEGVHRLRNPHNLGGYTAHDCFYFCNDWSTIFDVVESHGTYRMLVETGNPEPLWGERVFLYSTSGSIQNEPWGRNKPNHFAFFRNRFWYVDTWAYLQDYKDIIRGYPQRDKYPIVQQYPNYYSVWHEDSLQYHAPDNPSDIVQGFIDKVLEGYDFTLYSVISDYLEDIADPLADYFHTVLSSELSTTKKWPVKVVVDVDDWASYIRGSYFSGRRCNILFEKTKHWLSIRRNLENLKMFMLHSISEVRA